MLYIIDLILLIPIVVLGLYSQIRINTAVAKYSKIQSCSDFNGESIARRVLDSNNLYHIRVEQGNGFLSDQYNKKKKSVVLSRLVFDQKTIAAITIATRQCSCAVQDSENRFMYKVREMIIIIARIVSILMWGFVVLGIFINPKFYHLAVLSLVMSFIIKLIIFSEEVKVNAWTLNVLRSIEVFSSEYDCAKNLLNALKYISLAELLGNYSNIIRLFYVDKDKAQGKFNKSGV
jgi:Zn-dependent membrane protease YugP